MVRPPLAIGQRLASPSEQASLFKAQMISALQAGEWPNALIAAEQRLKLAENGGAPDYFLADCHLYVGLCLFKMHRNAEAVASLQGSIKLARQVSPSAADREVKALTLLAMIALESGNFADAENDARNALGVQPLSGNGVEAAAFDARLVLVQLMMDSGSYAELEALLDINDKFLEDHGDQVIGGKQRLMRAKFLYNVCDFHGAHRVLSDYRDEIDQASGHDETIKWNALAIQIRVAIALGDKAEALELIDCLNKELLSASNEFSVAFAAVEADFQWEYGFGSKARILTEHVVHQLDESGMLLKGWWLSSIRIVEARMRLVDGDIDAAERALDAALASSGETPPPVGMAHIWRMRATVWKARGEPQKAAEACEAGLAAIAKAPRPEDNTRADLALAAATCWLAAGDRDRALKRGLESAEAEESILGKGRPSLPLSDSLGDSAFMHRFSAADIIFECGSDSNIADYVLTSKGRGFSAAFTPDSNQSSTARTNLWSARKQLFKSIEFPILHDPVSIEERTESLLKLVARVEEAEFLTGARKAGRQLTPQKVRDELGLDTAFVDWIGYPKLKLYDSASRDNSRGQEMIGAVIYTKASAPRWIQIGTAEEVKLVIDRWSMARSAGFLREAELVAALSSLYEQLWKPVAAVLPTSIHHVIICPDVPLSFVPWPILRDDESGLFLLERYGVRMIQSGRETRADSSPLRSGNDKAAGLFINNFSVSGTATSEQLQLPNLDGVLKEEAVFKKAFPSDKQIIINPNSSEREVRSGLTHAEIVHVATHSYYFKDRDPTVWSIFSKKHASGAIVRDLFASCLVLNGGTSSLARWEAGTYTDSAEDGCLTLAELSRLNFRRAKLVVLAACETQLASSIAGEGLMGYQRVLHGAGARNVILTLWDVPDDLLPDFFDRYYARLENGSAFYGPFVDSQRAAFAEIRKRTLSEAIISVGALMLSVDTLSP